MSAQPEPEPDETEWEIAELVAEHGSERAALRAVLHDLNVLLLDADQASSRGFLRGLFSAGARRPDIEDEP
ncbi:hypothetical protein [Bosea lathyri]|uniref:Uncharacterized protein n=1 Tax=Bosea lathyri TaxID=1036778 RepID=A0A1H6BKY1_9HYPH|nr:hypothetical protein [Bosea lathyri]SEG61037.1 hypothetical protein SAMN04488115_107301 [Bosea lathyri]